jgi:lipid A 3-O-deacylase
MRIFTTLLATAALSIFLAGIAHAGDAGVEHLSFGAGYFDIINGDEGAAQFSAEYRGNYVWEGIRPVVGVSIDHNGGLYGYGGANWDFFLGDDWVLAPNFVVGGYHQGDSKDLGHALEFRSGLELDYVMDDESRVGVTFNHISNASIGDKNPGSESLMLIYSHPIYMWNE